MAEIFPIRRKTPLIQSIVKYKLFCLYGVQGSPREYSILSPCKTSKGYRGPVRTGFPMGQEKKDRMQHNT